MKKGVLLCGFIFLMTRWADAQTASLTTVPTALPLPTPNTNYQRLNLRTWNEMQKILKDVSSGKITKAQADQLFSQWSTILHQAKTLATQSGETDYSTSDMNQLNPMMDSLDAAIP